MTVTAARAPQKGVARFKVENGVPMPEPRKKDAGYPFMDMMPSQSFFVAEKDAERAVTLSKRIASAARQFSKKHGDGKFRYVTRVVEGGVRCWRWQ